jgi:predicted peptidase
MTPASVNPGLSLTVTHQATYRYLLYEPAEPASSTVDARPIVFFFHGKGERGSDLRVLERHGLPQLIAAGRALPYIVVSPQCPENEYWSDAPLLPEFVAAAVERHRADPTRVYLTGMSMGGFAVWSLAQRHPERYAAILPICGGGETRWALRLRDVPAWVFHGAQDNVIPPARSIDLVEAIRAAGGSPRFTLYPNAGHDAWTPTYANEEIHTWLLAHRRSPG